jgi:hypothetical protein
MCAILIRHCLPDTHQAKNKIFYDSGMQSVISTRGAIKKH